MTIDVKDIGAVAFGALSATCMIGLIHSYTDAKLFSNKPIIQRNQICSQKLSPQQPITSNHFQNQKMKRCPSLK
jgi:hypothetical protein